ncbi:MAG TPA: reverse transcriptase/maturase family protein [Allosphingosinicella sp.]
MSVPDWFRHRGYRHFDVPVGVAYAEALSPEMVRSHSWSPLIHYTKTQKRYKPLSGKTVLKSRPIMYASHRDSCILSHYSYLLSGALEKWYATSGTGQNAIAYRSLGASNYHFAKDVRDFIISKSRVQVLCFDVTGFFDNLQHRLLKERLRWVLGLPELSDDWYSVFKAVTRYHFVNLDELKGHPQFNQRIRGNAHVPIATIAEIKAAGIPIVGNKNPYGIPQGTPISACLSNLYMTDFDEVLARQAEERGALYRRYSDDILIACDPAHGDEFESLVDSNLAARGLALQKSKTERKTLSGKGRLTFQYLGFQLGRAHAIVRPGSLSRQWRAARRAVRKAEKAGLKAIRNGKATQTFTKKLHLRFNDARARNFLAYSARSAEVLESKAIKNQTKRLRRFIHREMARLKGRPTKP